jgi:hypothetical protein
VLGAIERGVGARFITSATSSPFRSRVARPIEIVTSMRFSPLLTEKVSPAIERRRRSATRLATCRSVSGITMTNSSPP